MEHNYTKNILVALNKNLIDQIDEYLSRDTQFSTRAAFLRCILAESLPKYIKNLQEKQELENQAKVQRAKAFFDHEVKRIKEYIDALNADAKKFNLTSFFIKKKGKDACFESLLKDNIQLHETIEEYLNQLFPKPQD